MISVAMKSKSWAFSGKCVAPKRLVEMKKEDDIRAVHDDDLNNLLDSLGLLKDFNAGKFQCFFCQTKVDGNNLNALLPVNNKIQFSCDNPICVKALMSHLAKD